MMVTVIDKLADMVRASMKVNPGTSVADYVRHEGGDRWTFLPTGRQLTKIDVAMLRGRLTTPEEAKRNQVRAKAGADRDGYL